MELQEGAFQPCTLLLVAGVWSRSWHRDEPQVVALPVVRHAHSVCEQQCHLVFEFISCERPAIVANDVDRMPVTAAPMATTRVAGEGRTTEEAPGGARERIRTRDRSPATARGSTLADALDLGPLFGGNQWWVRALADFLLWSARSPYGDSGVRAIAEDLFNATFREGASQARGMDREAVLIDLEIDVESDSCLGVLTSEVAIDDGAQRWELRFVYDQAAVSRIALIAVKACVAERLDTVHAALLELLSQAARDEHGLRVAVLFVNQLMKAFDQLVAGQPGDDALLREDDRDPGIPKLALPTLGVFPVSEAS